MSFVPIAAALLCPQSAALKGNGEELAELWEWVRRAVSTAKQANNFAKVGGLKMQSEEWR
jgi:hypothetical protein